MSPLACRQSFRVRVGEGDPPYLSVCEQAGGLLYMLTEVRGHLVVVN